MKLRDLGIFILGVVSTLLLVVLSFFMMVTGAYLADKADKDLSQTIISQPKEKQNER